MPGIVLKLFAIAIGLLLVCYAAANAFRSARRLDQRIEEFKEEQEALQKKGGPINPMAALAGLYAEDIREQEEAARRAAARRQKRYADNDRRQEAAARRAAAKRIAEHRRQEEAESRRKQKGSE